MDKREKAKSLMDEKIDRFFDMVEAEMYEPPLVAWLILVAFLFGIVGGLLLGAIFHA